MEEFWSGKEWVKTDKTKEERRQEWLENLEKWKEVGEKPTDDCECFLPCDTCPLDGVVCH